MRAAALACGRRCRFVAAGAWAALAGRAAAPTLPAPPPAATGTTPLDVSGASSLGLGARAGLRYGALGLPLAFLALPLYVMLPTHYATALGMPLATVGVVLLSTRVFDAAADPFIGQAVDQAFDRSTRAAWSVAALAAAVLWLGFTALFFPPPGGVALWVWLSGGLLITYLAFSVLSVVHQAWGARLGGDTNQRASVVAWREGCGLVGVIVAAVLPPLLGLGVTSAVLLAGLVLGMAMLARAPRAPSRSRLPWAPARTRAHWALPWHGAPFRRLLAIFMLNGIASAIPATLVLFFVADRLQDSAAQALFLGAYFAAAAGSVPLWVRAVRRQGLARTWLFGMGLAVAAFAGVLALGAGDRAGFLAVCAASGIALGADLAIPGALLTGVVQRAGHGERAEGVYVGWWNSATKLNLGLAAGVTLPLLAQAGYTPGQRDAQALLALTLAYVLVPCALKLMAAALLWHWWIVAKADA